MKEKATTQDVIEVLKRCHKIGISESGVANAITSVPGADPITAAEDLVAWADGANGDRFSAGPMLLRFMRQQVKDNPQANPAEDLKSCLGCRCRFHRNQLDQGRCDPCYDEWAGQVLDMHDRLIAAQVISMKPVLRNAA